MSSKLFDTFEHYVECMRVSGKMDILWSNLSPGMKKTIKVLATEIRAKSINKKEM